jgi:segregation and condensation protein A
VIDGFLDQLRQRIALPRLAAPQGGSFERDLAESSEAFLAASVLVGLKAEVLEAATFPPEPLFEDPFGFEDPGDGLSAPSMALPRRPETHLRRRPVAPPPLQRPVTLGELIRQLEEIAERLEQEGPRPRHRPRGRAYSESAAIAQVSALAHREKLPETTAALSLFLLEWHAARDERWVGFDELVEAWNTAGLLSEDDLDRDRVGVFWALLFLSAQGKLELQLPVPEGLEAKVGLPYVGPAIISGIRPEHRLANDEIFGPVLAVIKVKDFEEALAVANGTAYKLTGGIYSRKPAHLERAKREYRVGNLYLNRGITGALVGRQPFGGFGMSGLGSKAGGGGYLEHFVVPRALCENTMRRGFAPSVD